MLLEHFLLIESFRHIHYRLNLHGFKVLKLNRQLICFNHVYPVLDVSSFRWHLSVPNILLARVPSFILLELLHPLQHHCFLCQVSLLEPIVLLHVAYNHIVWGLRIIFIIRHDSFVALLHDPCLDPVHLIRGVNNLPVYLVDFGLFLHDCVSCLRLKLIKHFRVVDFGLLLVLFELDFHGGSVVTVLVDPLVGFFVNELHEVSHRPFGHVEHPARGVVDGPVVLLERPVLRVLINHFLNAFKQFLSDNGLD